MAEGIRLFHSRRIDEAEQTRLEPTKAPGQLRNGIFGQYLYATPRMDQAILYALPFPNSEHSFMTTLEPSDPADALARFDSRPGSAMRSARFSNRVYSMDSSGFEPVLSNPREWICPRPVDAIKTESVVHCLEQALRAGVQYFTLAPGHGPEAFERFAKASIEGSFDRAMLAKEIAKPGGCIVWENEAFGLGLDPELASEVAKARDAVLASVSGKLATRRANSPAGLAAPPRPTLP